MKVFKLKGLTMYQKIDKKKIPRKIITVILTTAETKKHSKMLSEEGLIVSHRETTRHQCHRLCRGVEMEPARDALLSE